MYKADDIIKKFGFSRQMLQQQYADGIIQSESQYSKEDIFRILCAECLADSGANVAQIKMILSAIHPSRQLNVGVYTPHDGMLTVFFVPFSHTEQRRHALDQIWKLQSKSRVTVMINFEKILQDIEAALGSKFEIKG